MSSQTPIGDGTRQAVLVALCLVGLVIGAIAMPPVENGSGSVGLPEDANTGLLEDLLSFFDDGPGLDDDSGYESGCHIQISEKPVPGREVTVVVSHEGQPVEGARVSINDKQIGETDLRGRVTGRVPYKRPVVVKAKLPGGTSCQGSVTGESRDENSEFGAREQGRSSFDATATATYLIGSHDALSGSQTAFPEVRRREREQAQAQGQIQIQGTGLQSNDGQVTKTYETDEDIDIEIQGTPYPGESVTLVADIDGEPVPEATVRVDGTRVGETNSFGQYELSVPADGTKQLRVEVERGDYRGADTLTVALLQANVSPTTVLAIPTQEAVLQASIRQRPVTDAVVTLDGERLGETNVNGTLQFTLPADPTATVRVSAADQTTTVSLGLLYASTILLCSISLLTIGAVAVVAFRRLSLPETTSASDSSGLVSRLRQFLDRLVRRALGVATRLTEILNDVEAWLRERWRAVRASPRSIGTYVLVVVRTLPTRIRRALVTCWRWVRGVPGRLRALLKSGHADSASDSSVPSPAVPNSTATEPTTLRERWRTFAQWVVPNRWRRRTPGEVARAAVNEGYPREPVRELSTVFREVEYGGRALSTDRDERARESFDTLTAHQQAERTSTGTVSRTELDDESTRAGDNTGDTEVNEQ